MIDLEALPPTRRFVSTVLDDCHVVVKSSLSHLKTGFTAKTRGRARRKLQQGISIGVAGITGYFILDFLKVKRKS